MPFYRFNIHNSIGFVEDEEGRHLPDLEAARAEALKGIRSILAEDVLEGRLDLCGRLEVLDDSRHVLTIPFADAIKIAAEAAQ